ncbi:MAG: RNA 2'-phosphotransferase [Desulfobacteraceae bacterium]|jgi:putative RNA 2'-phosphotransferase
MRRELIKDSKFLSFILRHDPSAIGVELDDAGWIEVSRLLCALQLHRPQITRERLIEIVETNDKKRFAFSEDRESIRASQGHSISIDLGLPPTLPPSLLYHGTSARNLKSIRNHGLLRGQRHHVHLSPDENTAIRVGSRHGKPVVLRIEAERMTQSGFTFYVSENGVWLTEYVPPSFIMVQNDQSE